MDINKIVKNADIINYTPLPYLIKRSYSGLGSILLFHNIAPIKNKSLDYGSYYSTCTPQHLEEIINFYKKNNYTFLSLDQVHNYLSDGIKPPKFITFTFDDGMLDNYQYAYPIFKKYNVPFAIYIATSFINKGDVQISSLIEKFLIERDSIDFQGFLGKYLLNTSDFKLKNSLMKEIIDYIEKYQEHDSVFKLMRNNQFTNFDNFERSYMSWDNVIEMNENKLCTILLVHIL